MGDSTREEDSEGQEEGLLSERKRWRDVARRVAASLGGEDSLLSKTSRPWSRTAGESGKSGGGSDGKGGGEDSGRGGRSPSSSSSESKTTRSLLSVRGLSAWPRWRRSWIRWSMSSMYESKFLREDTSSGSEMSSSESRALLWEEGIVFWTPESLTIPE